MTCSVLRGVSDVEPGEAGPEETSGASVPNEVSVRSACIKNRAPPCHTGQSRKGRGEDVKPNAAGSSARARETLLTDRLIRPDTAAPCQLTASRDARLQPVDAQANWFRQRRSREDGRLAVGARIVLG